MTGSTNNARQRIPRLSYSRRDFYRQLSRHAKKSTAVFLLVLSGAALLSFLAPAVYQSQSILYVRLGRENVRLDPTATFGQAATMSIPQSRESEIHTAVELLKSRAMAEQVVEALGPEVILEKRAVTEVLETEPMMAGSPTRAAASWRSMLDQDALATSPSYKEEAIAKLSKNFSAQAIQKTDLLSLSYRTGSPELAQAVVAKFTQAYLDAHAGLNRAPNALSFLQQQTERLRLDLAQSEERLRTLKQDTELASPDSQRELLVSRLGRLEDELLAADTQVVSTQSEVETLKEKLEQRSATQVATTIGLSNAAADGMRQSLYGLQLQENELAGKVTDDHPKLKAIRKQIAEAEAILGKEQASRSTVTEAPNRIYEELDFRRAQQEALLASAQAKADSLRSQVADAKEMFQKQIANELRIATLQREIQLQEINYRKYVDNLEQAHIDHAMEEARISNINVVQPATFSDKPIGPKTLLNLLAGLLVGAVAAVGLAILCDVLDHSLKTPEEIEEKLNLPLLVSIPYLDSRQLALSGRQPA